MTRGQRWPVLLWAGCLNLEETASSWTQRWTKLVAQDLSCHISATDCSRTTLDQLDQQAVPGLRTPELWMTPTYERSPNKTSHIEAPGTSHITAQVAVALKNVQFRLTNKFGLRTNLQCLTLFVTRGTACMWIKDNEHNRLTQRHSHLPWWNDEPSCNFRQWPLFCQSPCERRQDYRWILCTIWHHPGFLSHHKHHLWAHRYELHHPIQWLLEEQRYDEIRHLFWDRIRLIRRAAWGFPQLKSMESENVSIKRKFAIIILEIIRIIKNNTHRAWCKKWLKWWLRCSIAHSLEMHCY